MGLLDYMTGNDAAASPWGALYQNPDAATAADLAKKQDDASRAQMAAAMMSGNPAADSGVAAPSVFGPVPQIASPQQAPAPQGFGAGAVPFGFAGPGSMSGISPAMMAPQPQAGAPAPAAPPVPPAPPAAAATAPEQADPIAVGGYQMPRVGAADAFEPDDAGAPAAGGAGGRAPGAPAPGAPAAAPFSLGGAGASFGDRLMKGTAGFIGNLHNGPIGAIAGGLGALITGRSTDPQGIATEHGNLTARALLAKGVAPDVVQAAIYNPEIMKTLIAQNFGPDKFQHVTRKDGLGGESIGAFDPSTGKVTFDNGGGGGSGAPGFGAVLAQGVQYDPNKSGDAYMAQFSPEVQAAAKAYINGDVMPTGNARKDSIATFAKTVALKYGQDTGQPVSDATYGAKRKMQTDLASSTNGTMGGILSNGESSFKHLAEYTISAADQGNASHNFPGGGMLAHAQNYIGNTGGGSDTQAKVKAINDNLGKYGAESTKFYAGTGGGVEERLNALKEMNATTTSGEEAAAYAAKEKSLMLDRLNTKFQEIRNTLGEERGNAEIAKHMPDIQKNIATIDANIARLRGGGGSAPSAPAGAPPPGKYVWTPTGGLAGGK